MAENPLNKLYFAIEDQYYNVLDFLDHKLHLPVYKLWVEPIESKRIPSLPIAALLLFAIIFGVYSIAFATHTTTLTFLVTDSADNPLSGVQASLLLNGEPFKATFTDESGRAIFDNVPVGSQAILRLSKEGFSNKSQSTIIEADKRVSIVLESLSKESTISLTANSFLVKLLSPSGTSVSDISVLFLAGGESKVIPTNEDGEAYFDYTGEAEVVQVSITEPGYQKVMNRYRLSSGQATIMLQSTASNTGNMKGKLTVNLKTNNGTIAGTVHVYSADTTQKLVSKSTGATGAAVFDGLEVATKVFIVASDKEDRYMQYNGRERNDTFAITEDTAKTITLVEKSPEKVGKIKVLVSDTAGKSVSSASVILYSQGTQTEISERKTDSSGAVEFEVAAGQSYYVTAWKRGMLPDRAKDLEIGKSATLVLDSIVIGNTVDVVVNAINEDELPQSGVKIELWDANAGYRLGIPTQSTGGVNGTTVIKGVPLKWKGSEYAIRAFGTYNARYGISDGAAVSGTMDPMIVRIPPATANLTINLFDFATGMPISGNVTAINEDGGEEIGNCTSVNGICLMTVRAGFNFYLEAEASGYLTATATGYLVALNENKNISIMLYPANFNDLSIVFDENVAIKPGRDTQLTFNVTAPSGFDQVGFFVMIGPSSYLIAEQGYGIVQSSLFSDGKSEIIYSTTYMPSPDCKVDLKNTKPEDGMIKWVEYRFVNRSGTFSIPITVRVNTGVLEDTMTVYYRVFGVKNKTYFRFPEDFELGMLEKTKDLDSCYAALEEKIVPLSLSGVVCSSGACLSAEFKPIPVPITPAYTDNFTNMRWTVASSCGTASTELLNVKNVTVAPTVSPSATPTATTNGSNATVSPTPTPIPTNPYYNITKSEGAVPEGAFPAAGFSVGGECNNSYFGAFSVPVSITNTSSRVVKIIAMKNDTKVERDFIVMCSYASGNEIKTLNLGSVTLTQVFKEYEIAIAAVPRCDNLIINVTGAKTVYVKSVIVTEVPKITGLIVNQNVSIKLTFSYLGDAVQAPTVRISSEAFKILSAKGDGDIRCTEKECTFYLTEIYKTNYSEWNITATSLLAGVQTAYASFDGIISNTPVRVVDALFNTPYIFGNRIFKLILPTELDTNRPQNLSITVLDEFSNQPIDNAEIKLRNYENAPLAEVIICNSYSCDINNGVYTLENINPQAPGVIQVLVTNDADHFLSTNGTIPVRAVDFLSNSPNEILIDDSTMYGYTIFELNNALSIPINVTANYDVTKLTLSDFTGSECTPVIASGNNITVPEFASKKLCVSLDANGTYYINFNTNLPNGYSDDSKLKVVLNDLFSFSQVLPNPILFSNTSDEYAFNISRNTERNIAITVTSDNKCVKFWSSSGYLETLTINLGKVGASVLNTYRIRVFPNTLFGDCNITLTADAEGIYIKKEIPVSIKILTSSVSYFDFDFADPYETYWRTVTITNNNSNKVDLLPASSSCFTAVITRRSDVPSGPLNYTNLSSKATMTLNVTFKKDTVISGISCQYLRDEKLRFAISGAPNIYLDILRDTPCSAYSYSECPAERCNPCAAENSCTSQNEICPRFVYNGPNECYGRRQISVNAPTGEVLTDKYVAKLEFTDANFNCSTMRMFYLDGSNLRQLDIDCYNYSSTLSFIKFRIQKQITTSDSKYYLYNCSASFSNPSNKKNVYAVYEDGSTFSLTGGWTVYPNFSNIGDGGWSTSKWSYSAPMNVWMTNTSGNSCTPQATLIVHPFVVYPISFSQNVHAEVEINLNNYGACGYNSYNSAGLIYGYGSDKYLMFNNWNTSGINYINITSVATGGLSRVYINSSPSSHTLGASNSPTYYRFELTAKNGLAVGTVYSGSTPKGSVSANQVRPGYVGMGVLSILPINSDFRNFKAYPIPSGDIKLDMSSTYVTAP